jgi:membrane protein DedA with SNARE-associated domain
MTSIPDLLLQYGVVVLFAWAFAVQAGVPAPAVPMLLGAGVLSGSGRMHLALAVAGSAGVVPICLGRFVLYAAAGAFLWAGVWITLG